MNPHVLHLGEVFNDSNAVIVSTSTSQENETTYEK